MQFIVMVQSCQCGLRQAIGCVLMQFIVMVQCRGEEGQGVGVVF